MGLKNKFELNIVETICKIGKNLNFTYFGPICCGHQIGLIYFIQYFQLVFLWNAFGRPTGVFHGRFT